MRLFIAILFALWVAPLSAVEDLGICLDATGSAPPGVDRPLGIGRARSATQAIAAASFTNLNADALTTFSRTTSAWDPVNNAIKYASQRRQRTFAINGTNYSADLIESARTNLLASGTSEHFERWTVGSGTPVVTTDTLACPNAEVVADTLTEGVGTGTQGVAQSVTKAASSLAYVGSCYIKNKTGSREVIVELDDGTTTNGVAVRINPATGVLTSAPAAFGAGWAVNTAAGTSGYTITDAGGGWYRVSVIATSDTTTTVRFRVALYNAADSYAGDGTSAVYLWGADANQATFAAATCLCRNLCNQSETLGTTWGVTRASVSSNAVADPITGNTTADKLVEDATAGATHFIAQGSFVKTASASYTFTVSLYAKQAGRTWIGVALAATNALTNSCRGFFDLGNGVTGSSTTSGAGFAVTSKSITSVGNGWYRCVLVGTSDTTANVACGVLLATADTTISYNGDGTSGAYLWGAQVEYGSTANQYWATTTAGLRTADVLLSTLTSLTDARTNRAIWSEQFDNAAWTKTDVTVTANSGTDPNGNGYCDLLTEGVAGTALTASTSVVISAGAPIFGASYFKASAVNSWVRVQVLDATSNGWRAWYNLTTGAVGSTAAVGTGTATSLTIERCGNGWYRCSTLGAVDPASIGAVISVCSASANASNTPVASSAYYAFGAYFRANVIVGTTNTDYIPTGSAAVAAPAGLSRTTGTLVSIVMPRNWTGDQDGSTAFQVVRGNDASVSKITRAGATATPALVRNDLAGNQFPGSPTWNPTSGTLMQATMTWSPSAVTGYIDGAASGTPDSSLQAPFDAVTAVNIGATSTGTSAFFGYVLAFYSHQQVVPASTLALMYAATSAP